MFPLETSTRRAARSLSILVISTAVLACNQPTAAPSNVDLAYLDIATLQQRMESGGLTSVELVRFHLQRIEQLDRNGPDLRSIIEINPEAEAIAQALDRERAESGARGPLHGIPVVLKANIDTGDQMATTAGSLALAGRRAADDAFHVAGIREAGAIILGKANLSEWANFRSTRSSSGWSGIGGQVRNPHVLDRSPCGSSSGSGAAVAAGLSVLAVGTETDGSIVCPAGVNGIVGIKPTVGLVSRDGIIPIAHTQDTAGPMARSVRDAALLLAAMATADPQDPASTGHPGTIDPLETLSTEALKGARIGVWRSYDGARRRPRINTLLDQAVGRLEALGATVIDEIALEIPEEAEDGEWEVLQYEFKADLNRYLAEGGVDPSVDTLAELIEFNKANEATSMPWFGQQIFEMSQSKGPLTEPEYLEALEQSHVAVAAAIDALMNSEELDAIVAPTNGPAWTIDWVNGDSFSVSSSSPAAVSGYPAVTLPMGQIHHLPIGISFFGRAYSEARLIGYAYALEQDLAAWREPGFHPSMPESQ
jgi:amidase